MPQDELLALGLTPEEGFVLSRLSVPMSDSEVVAMTGLDGERAAAVLARLAEKGAIEVDAPEVDAPAPPPSGPTEGDPSWLEPLEPEAAPAEALPEESPAEGGEALAEGEEAPDAEKGGAEEELNYRKVYETTFRPLEASARAAAAQTARGAHLMALCVDQDPNVIRALVGNSEFGLAAARLVARHHRTATGLDIVSQRADLLKDANFQRRLLGNPQVSEALIKRLLNPKRMLDAYKLSINTDYPERTRQIARAVLRSKFAVSQGEERAGIISATEGRVLPILTGLTLDARATSILCARSYTSVLFIQNLARFGACPPPLLAHLLKQPMVRRQNHLKSMILQHPNLPSEAKRNL
jgi:hypothetical protein